MKQRFFNALVLTLIIIVMLCVVDVFRQYDSDLKLLKIIVVDLENQIIDINQNYLSSCDVVQPFDDLILLQNKVDKLEVEVDEYRQDVLFWNEQTGNYFGKYNTGYFREGRGK